jgi:hypothetical protein
MLFRWKSPIRLGRWKARIQKQQESGPKRRTISLSIVPRKKSTAENSGAMIAGCDAFVGRLYQTPIPVGVSQKRPTTTTAPAAARNPSVASGDGVSEGDIARFEVQLRFRRRAENARSFVVEFSFPSRDHNRGQTISDEIHAGATHVH